MENTTIHPSQLATISDNPTVDEAVAFMKTSMDIVDWNLKRGKILRRVGNRAYINGYVPSNDSYVARIDCSGLIVEVLGRDSKTKTKSKSNAHKPFKYDGKRGL